MARTLISHGKRHTRSQISEAVVSATRAFGHSSVISTKASTAICRGRWARPNAEDMPLWIVPDHKVSVQEVEACMRDHYEGTPLSLDQDIAQGLWDSPYRPTPLYFEVDGKKYFNERPTSTQQTAFSYVSQMRSWLPREIGGVLWFGNDDGNMVAYTPIYCGNTIQPECYNTPGADAVTFSDKNAYWVCNWVSNMVYPRYSQMFRH